MRAKLEHTILTVSDPDATTAWMGDVFDWKTRWSVPAIDAGYSVHVGGDGDYLALYRPKTPPQGGESSYGTIGGLNHLGVIVEDLDAAEARVRAAGFIPRNHADCQPGRRFYFDDADGIEFELVHYG